MFRTETDPSALRGALRDLFALSTLPAIWLGADRLRIAESLAAALYTGLAPVDFVYLGFRAVGSLPPVTVAQVDRYESDLVLAQRAAPLLLEWARTHDPDEFLPLPQGLRPRPVRVSARPLGIDAELGVLAVGILEPPTARQTMLLKAGVSQAITAIRNANLLHVAQSNEVRFETLVNAAPLGVYLVDSALRIRQVNPEARRLFGREDLPGQSLPEVLGSALGPAQLREVVARFRHTLDTGEVYHDPEWRSDQGSCFEWQLSRISLPEDGYGVVCYFRDITAEVTARRTLQESAQRMRFMAESMPQKIFTALPDGRVDYVNRQWAVFAGLELENLCAWSWTAVVHPDDHDEHFRLWKHALETGEPFEVVHRLRRADGAYRWHLSRARAMLDGEGRISMWIGSNTDIHEAKETEQNLRRANEDLNQFAFAASHDLQEPLRMIATYSQLLLKEYRERLSDQADVYVQYITEGAKRMRDLLGDLLAYTAAGPDGQHAADWVSLELVLEAVRRNLTPALAESGAEITSDPLPRVQGHEAHFVQLFENLIQNALKYRSEAPPRIHVGVESGRPEPRFYVQDNGIGIAPEYHQHIFGLFKRLHGKAIPGTGIGLSICRRVIERYGGRIWVESQPGAGARFCFTLPECSDQQVERSSSTAVPTV